MTQYQQILVEFRAYHILCYRSVLVHYAGIYPVAIGLIHVSDDPLGVAEMPGQYKEPHNNTLLHHAPFIKYRFPHLPDHFLYCFRKSAHLMRLKQLIAEWDPGRGFPGFLPQGSHGRSSQRSTSQRSRNICKPGRLQLFHIRHRLYLPY